MLFHAPTCASTIFRQTAISCKANETAAFETASWRLPCEVDQPCERDTRNDHLGNRFLLRGLANIFAEQTIQFRFELVR